MSNLVKRIGEEKANIIPFMKVSKGINKQF